MIGPPPTGKVPVRILVVDDSALFVEALSHVVERAPGLAVAGWASDGAQALERVVSLQPDLVTMDLTMPRMGGLEAVSRIMAERPTPILILTGDPRRGLDHVTFEALSRGALDLRIKPVLVDPDAAEVRELLDHMRLLASIKTVRHPGARRSPPRLVASPASSLRRAPVVGIAASTGGPTALREILGHLPAGFPARFVVAQHMSAGFVPHFVEWLRSHVALDVVLAQDGLELRTGAIHVAPDGRHAVVDRRGRMRLEAPPPGAGGHVPSADVLFRSMAESLGRAAIGVVLTGMGKDGAAGLLAIRRAGGATLAQDEATSVVGGMPRAAADVGAAERVLPKHEIATALQQLVEARARASGDGVVDDDVVG